MNSVPILDIESPNIDMTVNLTCQAGEHGPNGGCMEPQNQTDHIAILSLMMVGVLTKRLKDLGQLDADTSKHLHKLVRSVSTHAETLGIEDLTVLLKNIDKALS